MTKFAIDAQGLSKRFTRHLDRRSTLKERIVRGRSRNTVDFWALNNVDLQVPKGSVYGIVGHNGSGKSTLLKLVTGIYRPTSGTIKADGRVAALIELGAGFHPDMTGRENIRLNGSILGLSKKQISDAMEDIIDFSGLREFIDDPVKHYSSGMYVRLGFSVAVHMDPDTLLVDEVLAVGDEEFQRKCFDYLYTLRKAGKTIIVVSHGLGQLESLCDEITWLDHGETQLTGPSSQVIAAYLDRVNTQEAARNFELRAVRPDELGADRAGSGQIRVREVALTNPDGEPLQHAETGTTCTFRIDLQAYEPILGPNVRIAIQHEGGALVSMVNNHRFGIDLGTVEGPFVVETDIIDNPLLPARYRIHIDVFDHTGARLLDSWTEALDFAVRSPRGEIGQGFIDLAADFRRS